MSQHDYVIANDSGASVRADINSALQAILSQNSGTSAPSSTSAGTLWLDTTGGAPYTLKIRDAGNNHWLTIASITDPGSDGNLSVSAIEGTSVLSTGESGGTKFLREDGDGSCSFQELPNTGILMADQWRLTATLQTANGPITSNLERNDDGWFAQIGTGMSESSGIFTFPQTGVYLVSVSSHFISQTGAHSYGGIHIQITENNADYSNQVEKYCSVANTGYYNGTHCVAQIDVDNTTNIKVKFNRAAASTSFATIGDTNSNQTTFTFIRLGDT